MYRTILIAILAAASARADYMPIESQIIPGGVGVLNSQFFIPPFNPELGTLNWMNIGASGTVGPVMGFGGSGLVWIEGMVTLAAGKYGAAYGRVSEVILAPGTIDLRTRLSFSNTWDHQPFGADGDMSLYQGEEAWVLPISGSFYYWQRDLAPTAYSVSGGFQWSDIQVSGNYNYTPFDQPVTHTPEPATWALVGLGLAGMIAVRRRLSLQ